MSSSIAYTSVPVTDDGHPGWEAASLEASEVLARFHLEADKGLSSTQVLSSRLTYGANELPPDDGTPFWKLVLKQFDDLLVKILIAAAVVSFVLAIANGEDSATAFVEPLVILLILVANATVGVITETNAEKAIEELKAYQADVATVVRDGSLVILPATELVMGDIVEVTVGSKIPADLRLISLLSSQLRVDQAILTGESSSVSKDPRPVTKANLVYQDKTNILFSGTTVTVGRGRAVVVQVGRSTAIGKIQGAMMQHEPEMTPLKKKLDEFGTFLSKVIAVICVLVWVVNIGHFRDPAFGGFLQGAIYYFKIAVALAVAAIPEGLPAVVTTCLALGTKRMAKLHAIVRTLPSVETLGCTTVICSDKTGTLTTNQMSVSKVSIVQSTLNGPQLCEFAVSGTTFCPEGFVRDMESGMVVERPADLPSMLQVAMCSALCNDSVLHYNAGQGTYGKIGEATEVALRVLAEKVGLPGFGSMPSALTVLSNQDRASYCNNYWEQQFNKLATLEFSRDRKMMSVLCTRKGQEVLFAKGAPEVIAARSVAVLTNETGQSVPMTPELQRDIQAVVTSYGKQQTLRCLALAVRAMPKGHQQLTLADENHLTFLGLVGMLDPPREEVHKAVEACKSAGIRVIVVTGDNKATAESVCRQIGTLGPLEGPAGKSFTASEFDSLPPAEKAMAIRNLVLFSRVEPQHKSMLVDALKAQGHVVAMTGDGVNDAPALKKADIGIAMGSGTAVAKCASDMVLSDDNFSTIVAAVAEGRAIYNNTKQFIRYMVSSNIGEVVCIFVAAALGMPETLVPVQLLWVNLVTDGLPATALGFNKQDGDVMRHSPRRVDDGIVNGWLFFRYLVIGTYVGLATVAGFVWWYLWYQGGPQITWQELTRFDKCVEGEARYSCDIFLDRHPSTVSMSVLVTVEMFNALNNLSENHSLLVVPPWSNLWLLAAIAVSFILHFLILYVPPAATLFSVTALSLEEWLVVVYLSFPVILIDEVLKFVSRRHPFEGHVGAMLEQRKALQKGETWKCCSSNGEISPSSKPR